MEGAVSETPPVSGGRAGASLGLRWLESLIQPCRYPLSASLSAWLLYSLQPQTATSQGRAHSHHQPWGLTSTAPSNRGPSPRLQVLKFWGRAMIHIMVARATGIGSQRGQFLMVGSLADPTTGVPAKFTASFRGPDETAGRLSSHTCSSHTQSGSSAPLQPKPHPSMTDHSGQPSWGFSNS